MSSRAVGVDRIGRFEKTPEAEMAQVDVDVDDDVAILTLDDGERLVFTRSELRSALDGPSAA